MKIKTSVTLSEDLLKTIDRLSPPYKNRSGFIEAASRAFISQLARDRRNARDLEILNRNANRLNREALDTLTYQVPL